MRLDTISTRRLAIRAARIHAREHVDTTLREADAEGIADAHVNGTTHDGEAARREAARLMVETPWSASDAWVSAGACDTLGLAPRWRAVFLRALDRNVRRLSLRAMA